MPRVDVKITFHKPQVVAAIKAASDYGLSMTGIQALKDTSQYVPKDQATLESSGLSSSSRKRKSKPHTPMREGGYTTSDKKAVDGELTLRWSTPYAQYLWHGDVMHGNPNSRTYGPEKLKFTEAMAREEWAKYAQKVHGETWKKVYEAALKKGLIT